MSTKLKDLIPILICQDVQKSIVFYCHILGFEVVHRMDDVGKTGWASLLNGDVQIMLGSAGYLPEPKKTDGKYPQVQYYLYPEEIVAMRDSIIAKNYPVSDLAVRFYGMKEFELTDPDGHMIIFGQETDEPPTPE
jgi:uncharacterized glyoxalase superfamily protein PhnB